jgi:hypothetical protein
MAHLKTNNDLEREKGKNKKIRRRGKASSENQKS